MPTLMEYFEDITLIETGIQYERIRETVPKHDGLCLLTFEEFRGCDALYDAIFLISVLHIIPRPTDRREILKTINEKVKEGGYIVIDVPNSETYYQRRCNEENRFQDGWVMGSGRYRTFYKNFSAKELDGLLWDVLKAERIAANRQEKHVTRLLKKA